MSDRMAATSLGRPPKPASRAPGIRPGLFYGVFAALVATNVATLLVLLVSPDISALINGQTGRQIAAYQDRLTQLRLDVDRLHSRQYAHTGDINLQLQELAQQQEVLAEQHQYVKALAEKAAELGIAPLPATTLGKTSGTSKDDTPDPLPAKASVTSSDAGEAAIEQAGHQVRKMMDESREALAAISTEATESTDQIMASLNTVGIKPTLVAANGNDATGGPLLPPRADGEDETIVDEANDVAAALSRFKEARAAIEDAPIHKPFDGLTRISSPFGNRTDPFTGRLAFHPGIDFPWPTGTPVKSAGAGKVIFVGQINGYGNVIDIDHGDGIVTRYGHLSAFLVNKGEEVETGTPIGRVGSTGRSTGPHLHFEVRRDDSPVNPTAYLALGTRLARFVTPTASAPAGTGDMPIDDGPSDQDGTTGGLG